MQFYDPAKLPAVKTLAWNCGRHELINLFLRNDRTIPSIISVNEGGLFIRCTDFHKVRAGRLIHGPKSDEEAIT